ncbi:MAG TPA: TIGR04222 domain-containing membrane protein [Xanthobacteraceae bacterium]
MFPLDLPGPQFATFYLVFAMVVIAALHFGRRHLESGPPPVIDPKDPYLLACLRGGPKEVVCVATLGLIDRGLLQISDRQVVRAPNARPALVGRRIEQAVLGYFEDPADLFSVLKAPSALAVAEADYEDRLRRDGLIPDTQMRNTRHQLMIAASACLVGLGGVKLMIALGAGRHNVLFLIGMMSIAVVVIWKIGDPYRAVIGDSYLAGVRTMFAGLRDRATSIRPGSGSREFLWLTSLFGIAALPSTAFPFAKLFKPKGGSGCGSSCGSGGGGCGGGGGGCGGCGS